MLEKVIIRELIKLSLKFYITSILDLDLHIRMNQILVQYPKNMSWYDLLGMARISSNPLKEELKPLLEGLLKKIVESKRDILELDI